MAVYTDIEENALKNFLLDYDLGSLISFEGITEGVENSNYRLVLSSGNYILTLFEKRVNSAELPWFVGYMGHLAKNNISCPLPIKAKDGQALRQLANRPALIVTFLDGQAVKNITEQSCLELGRALAKLHKAGEGFDSERSNKLGAQGWKALLSQCDSHGDQKIEALISQTHCDLEKVLSHWPEPKELPRGQIHADLFPDNVFFKNESLSGIIDFYFACTDFFAYDIAICINAWCFENNEHYLPQRTAMILQGYEEFRPLSPLERNRLPVLCQGAALRFLLTRLYDWIHTPPGAKVVKKNPWDYQKRLTYFLEHKSV
ncbi:homoserine kinase [Aristophania vespae]|uniref:Homoserine kinase n=1 Tax=Aristophania vespae TaxID=2697033 RepID=A0A6P1NGX4_9PROT|nr:homoserine kinase [Aristophania vespae]QHI95764.1 homoserine kinase [Aristophania vespae]